MAETNVKALVVTKNDAGKQKISSFPNVNPEASMDAIVEVCTLYGSLMEDAPVEIRRQETSIQEV